MTQPGIGLRSGLRRLSTGLIAYGVIGLLIALLGLAALAWVNGRIDSLAVRAGAQVDAVIASLDETANVLTLTGTTAGSFSGTLDRTASSLNQAAETIRNVRPRLTDMETQFRSINILGSQPLSSAADAAAEISAGLEGLDTQLEQVGQSLVENRSGLDRYATSLTALGVRLGAQADRLRTGIGTVADVQGIIRVALLVFTAWTAVPAVGAMGLGWWLRRHLGPAPAKARPGA